MKRSGTMSVRNDDKFLKRVKKTLLIPEDDTYSNDEIKLHIEACCQYLITTGVPDDVVRSENPLVEGLILIFVKTYFGFKSDGSVKELPPSFHLLTRQLVLTSSE